MAADATLSDTLHTLDQEATPGPWEVRPIEYDDWGWVRGPVDATGFRPVVAKAGYDQCIGSEDDLDAHRIAGTDPCAANARLISYVRTHLPEIISHLEAGWQPIETLPEGKPVFGLCAHGGRQGYGVIVGVKHDLMSRGPDWILDEWSGRSARCVGWMPLPASPVMGEGASGQ